MYLGIFVGSLLVLLKASDVFVDSAEEIGLSFGISPFVIGVTIIAFGTSLPELATSIAAVLGGNSEIVLGSVVGSNITNIALVLGIVSIVSKKIVLENNIWEMDMPFLWASAFMLWFVVQDGHVYLPEALVLICCIIIFLVNSFKGDEETTDSTKNPKASIKTYIFLLLGGVFVWLSADYTIYAIQELSTIAGIPPEIIALSAVALGTSLPEVIVSVNAARKGKTSIAVGNVLGSNIFNTFFVLGIPALIGDLKIAPQILEFSLPLMIAMTILFGLAANDKEISRTEGLIFLMFYAIFMIDLFKGFV